MKKSQGISFFERTLTLWVAICIVAGILIGLYIPSVPATLHQFEYANVSIPVAILIWLMIFPMMLKVDFNSVKNVGRKPKGILITGVTNWLIKPFTMFAIAWFFFFVVFKSLIPAALADQYLAGAVLLGAAPCTAMVFVWSHLTRGDRSEEHTSELQSRPHLVCRLLLRPPPRSPLFPYTTLFRSTGVTNWLIKPFTMFAIAWFFFFVVFKSLIPAALADQYLAGAVLLGAAPCTAMVFVWSHLTRGD